MSDDDRAPPDPALAEFLALIVHDLRNPIATISANISYLRDVSSDDDDPEIESVLDDVQGALTELTRGLEHVGWIGAWIGDSPPVGVRAGDARDAVREAVTAVGGPIATTLPDEPVWVDAGGTPLSKVVELFLRNATRHGRAGVSLSPDGVIEVYDDGPAIGPDLRERVFSMAGQRHVKTRRDGRYERVVGLLAARALAETLGLRVEADGEDGAAVFRIRLRGS